MACPKKSLKKLEQQIGGCGRGAFSANWSRFRSSRLTSSTHNLTSRGEATKCKLNIQCNKCLQRKGIMPYGTYRVASERTQQYVFPFWCTMLQATRSDLLNPSRGIWWFHLLRACIPPCGTGAMMQDACKSRKCIDQQRACL